VENFVELIFFLAGLALGLVQLYVAQRQFEFQQRQRMDEIRRSLNEIEKQITIMQQSNSERAYDFQDRLLQMVAREEAISENAEEAKAEIRELIISELKKLGIQNAVEQYQALESQLSEIINKTTKSVKEIIDEDPSELTPRQKQVFELVLKGDGMRTIAEKLSINVSSTRILMDRIFRKLGVTSKTELIEKYSHPETK